MRAAKMKTLYFHDSNHRHMKQAGPGCASKVWTKLTAASLTAINLSCRTNHRAGNHPRYAPQEGKAE